MIRFVRTSALMLSLLIAGCAASDTPILGTWRGRPPGREPGSHRTVDLVLDGTPDAASGAYRIASTESDPNVTSGHGQQRWGGTWVRGSRVVNGRTITTITLKEHLPDDVGAYALGDDGALRVLDANGLPDTTPAGALYTLSPVSRR